MDKICITPSAASFIKRTARHRPHYFRHDHLLLQSNRAVQCQLERGRGGRGKHGGVGQDAPKKVSQYDSLGTRHFSDRCRRWTMVCSYIPRAATSAIASATERSSLGLQFSIALLFLSVLSVLQSNKKATHLRWFCVLVSRVSHREISLSCFRFPFPVLCGGILAETSWSSASGCAGRLSEFLNGRGRKLP